MARFPINRQPDGVCDRDSWRVARANYRMDAPGEVNFGSIAWARRAARCPFRPQKRTFRVAGAC